jgi:NAD(P)-dependent dehydrogenase (short-subunit alcohol dehydrogenase family)
MADRVVVVTGSTRGIGLGIVQQMADHGARVIASSRDRVSCDKVSAELNDARGKVIAKAIPYDLEDRRQAGLFAVECGSAFGRIDVLVCNAAVLINGGFDKILTGNIHGNYDLCEAFRPLIARQGGGAMILIGSVAGHTPMHDILAYAVSKAGVSHMARCLAEEMVGDRIRVNCVAPGLVRTSGAEDDMKAYLARAEAVPLGRGREPADIAGACVFLASDAGAYVTGTTLWVDGGRTFLRPRSLPLLHVVTEGTS